MNITSIARFNKIPSTGFVPESSGTAPTSPAVGQLWIDTSVSPKLLKVWDGSAWAPSNLYGGTGANNYTVGNDARLSDARVPTDGSVTGGTAGAGVKLAANTITLANMAVSTVDASAATGSLRTLGTGALQAAAGNDARLSDARVPTDGSVTGGSPGAGVKIAPTTITIANLAAGLTDGTAGSKQVRSLGTGATDAAAGNDSRLSDTRTPTAGSVVDASVAAGAAIAESKLALATDAAVGTGSRRTLGYTGLSAMPGVARLDQIAAPTNPVAFGNQRLTGVAPSSLGTDAVNRNELDAARQGYAGAKDPVRVAATTNITLAIPGATIDGVTLATGDRVLLTAQTTALENGIWIWTGSAAPLTRAPDADAVGEIKDGTTVAVASGTSAGGVYIQTATVDATAPGVTNAETWVLYSTQATYVGTANRVTVTGTTIDIAASYAGQVSLVTLGTVTTGTWNATAVGLAYGGTGVDASNTAGKTTARANLGAAQAGYRSLITSALVAGTPLTITHNLNTDNCLAQVRDATTGEYVYPDVIDAPGTPNTLTVTSGIAISANAWDIVVIPI